MGKASKPIAIFRGPLLRSAWLSSAAIASIPALAEPVTYEGTVGTMPIAMEFTADPTQASAPFAARYFHHGEGIDIPLDFVTSSSDGVVLVEEKPCDRERCPEGKPPTLGAKWRLTSSDGGATLVGHSEEKRLLPVALKRVATRAAGADEQPTPNGLLRASEWIAFSDGIVDAATSPYDYIKLNIELDTVSTTDWNGSAFAMVADPRTGFSYPRIAALPGGANADIANEVLNQRHWRYNIEALGCASRRYLGMHDFPYDWGAGVGTLGGYDEMGTTVTQLTPRVMSWVESGSLWCGGGSPAHFVQPTTLDVERGELLSMTDLFIDWAQEGPGEPILEFIDAHRRKPIPGGYDDQHETECGMDDLIQTDLAAYLARDEEGRTLVTFGIYGLPTVTAACSGDLLTVPVGDVGRLLTPEASALLLE